MPISAAVNRSYLYVVLSVMGILELVSWTGICVGPSYALLRMGEAEFDGFVMISSRLGLFAFIFLAAGAPRREWITAFLGGVLFWLVADQGGVGGYGWADTTYLFFLDGVAITSLVLLARIYRKRETERYAWAEKVLKGGGICLLFSLVPPCVLSLSASLHPATNDLYLYHLDTAFGFTPSRDFAIGAESVPYLPYVLNTVYSLLPAALAILYGLQIASPRPMRVSMIEFMIASGLFSAIAYHLYPITGPSYVFGESFPFAMPSLEDLPFAQPIVQPAPRNGMPSMHVGWALALWLMSWSLHPLARAAYLLMFALTTIAILTTGEHYLIDAVVSLPVVAGLMAFCSRDLPWKGLRTNIVFGGLAFYAFWLFLMEFGIKTMLGSPVILWAATLFSTAMSVVWYRQIHQANRALGETACEPAALPAETIKSAHESGLGLKISLMFVMSGAAALIYQVLFSKQLAYVFGSMSTATNIVLATYMGGMAIGAWAGGGIAGRLRDPLRAFAICEFVIAIYCAISPGLFDWIQGAYVEWATGMSPDAHILLVMRVALGASILFIPTVVMGMTLPILVRFFQQRHDSVGVSAGRLYAANTIGAALGALMAGYFILPTLGLQRTTFFAVACNLIVVFLALNLSKKLAASGSALQQPESSPIQGPRSHALVAILALTIGGFVTLALEVGFIHLLAVAAGNSTYAFSLMLFAFLIGLGGGAEIGRALLKRFSPLPLMVTLQMTLAIAIIWGLYQINSLPSYFADFEQFQRRFDFPALEFIRGVACCLAMIPLAAVIGALFPVSIEAVTRGFHQRPIAMLGVASALNTVGNIFGVLVAGFVLIPLIGSFQLVSLMAGLVFIMGVTIALCFKETRRPWVAIPLLITSAIFFIRPANLNYDQLTTGANVYFAMQNWGRVIDHAESLDGGLTSVNESVGADGQRHLTLLTNGKFQGNNVHDGEMIAQTGFALAPLLHTAKRDSALVIGYGTGNTSKVLHDAGFASLDVVDLSADIIELANRHLSSVNGRVTDKDGVRKFVTDGRNYLMLTNDRYDLISMEVSSIWFAGAATLYNRDFYQLAKERLQKGGVLQQWMQLHHAYPLDIFYVLGSVRAEFRYVWLYYIGGQGIIVASNERSAEPTVAHIDQLNGTVGLNETIQNYGGTADNVAKQLLLSPEDMDRFLASQGRPLDFFISTDDNAYLEYSTPKGNALQGLESRAINYEMLAKFSSGISGAAGR